MLEALWYSNAGSVSMRLLPGLACGPNPLVDRRRRYPSPGSLLKQRQNPSWMKRKLGQPDPHSVMNRVGDGGNHRMQRTFAGLLRAVGALGIAGLDDHRGELRGIERGGDAIVEQRWAAVKTRRQIGHLLHRRLGVAHVDRAFDLPF